MVQSLFNKTRIKMLHLISKLLPDTFANLPPFQSWFTETNTKTLRLIGKLPPHTFANLV